MKNRDIAIDVMRAIAALFIVNSHLAPMYKDINPALATFGVHGDALFFFCAGFTAIYSMKKMESFSLSMYIKKKFNRLFSTVLMFFFLQNILINEPITWKNLLYADGFWFISHIFISYIVLFLLYKYYKSYLWNWFIFFIILIIIAVFILPKTEQTIYFNYIWHFCFFPSMILGLIISDRKSRYAISAKNDIIKAVISFISYFIIMYLSKGKNDWLFYIQLFSLIPLHLFLYYCYKSLSFISMKIPNNLINLFIFISGITLEIYMVHYSFISANYNYLFPFNIIVMYIITILSAYILKVCVNFYNQTISDSPYDIKNIFKVIN